MSWIRNVEISVLYCRIYISSSRLSNRIIVFYKNVLQNFQEKNLQVVPQLAAHTFSSWYTVACIKVVFLYCAFYPDSIDV